jgi:cell division control protein 7
MNSFSFLSTIMQFSHHSSNPLEVHTSDARNAAYHRHVAATAQDESSDELGRWSDKTTYQSHVSKVVGVDLGNLVIPPFKGKSATPVAGPSRRQLVAEYIDLDDDMESDDELATPYKEDYARAENEASKNAPNFFGDEDIAVDEQAGDDELPGQEERTLTHEEERMEEDEEQTYVEEIWENAMEPEEYVDISDEDQIMSPLTPLSDDEDMQLPPEWSSPQSSRPPSPDETRTLYSRPLEEQAEIQEEIEDLCQSVPTLADEYELLDRLGTGTFSSVYKALDLNYNNYDNRAWQGTHPPNSSAYYQRAGPSYRGRGGRRTTKEDAEEGGDNNHDGVYDGKVFVAIKRIYTTSGPERIRNEVAIMEDCRGARHVSQIITAFRALDQVVIVLPYQRNMDFRVRQLHSFCRLYHDLITALRIGLLPNVAPRGHQVLLPVPLPGA